MARWRGKDRILRVLKRLPAAVKAEAKVALDQEAIELVGALQRACPVDETLEAHPGELRESIRAYDGQRKMKSGGIRTELLKTIIADAKDAKGNYIGPHVEYGHRTPEGEHVPAHPWWWPTWRAQRRDLRKRLAAAGRAAVKRVAPELLR